MSRSLNDHFDDDDALGGSLDLETGSQVGGGGGISTYGGADGIDFDDELDSDGPVKALELDLPGGGATQARHAQMSAPPAAGGPVVPDLAFGAPASSRSGAPSAGAHASGSMGAVRPSGSMAAAHASGPSSASLPVPSGGPPSGVPSGAGAPSAPAVASKPTAAAIIAKYPPPPAEIYRAPRYALRVVLRQLELRTDLESLRRRRSPDVPLYEAALTAYDARTFRLGMALNAAAFTIATFLFFLPVILRFVRAD